MGIIAGLSAGAIYGVPQLISSGSGSKLAGAITHTVKTERLLVEVTEDGTIESAKNQEVKCEVSGGSTILWIVEDGKQVEEGEVVVRLDTSVIDEKLNTQKINYERALALKIQTEEEAEAAKISVREYAEGIYVQQLQELEAQIRIGMENLRSSENMLKYTQRMVRKGFATPLQLEADQFAVERSELELNALKTQKRVLTNFTREKTLRDLVAAREAALAQVRSETAALQLEEDKLHHLEQQLELCVLRAPQRGMAIYANNSSRRRQSSDGPDIQEGATVRERQVILQLPDLTSMQVKVTVHESQIEQIQIGMPAYIKIQDKELTGKVISIGNQPEPTSWFSANVKEYAVVVGIDGEQGKLKPGMTAHVSIEIADLEDVVTIPVSAVVEQDNAFYCWVLAHDNAERRLIKLGMTNDRMIEIIDGVKAGDVVLKNPRAVVPEARRKVATRLTTPTDKSAVRPAGNRPGPSAPGEPPKAKPEGRTSAGQIPPGNRPPGKRPPGKQPAGNRPTGNRPTGNRPTGTPPAGPKTSPGRPAKTGQNKTGQPTGN